MATIYNNKKVFLTGDDLSIGVVFNNITKKSNHRSSEEHNEYLILLKEKGLETGEIKIHSSKREETATIKL